MYIVEIIHLQCVTYSCHSKCEICTVTQGFVDILMVKIISQDKCKAKFILLKNVYVNKSKITGYFLYKTDHYL